MQILLHEWKKVYSFVHVFTKNLLSTHYHGLGILWVQINPGKFLHSKSSCEMTFDEMSLAICSIAKPTESSRLGEYHLHLMDEKTEAQS